MLCARERRVVLVMLLSVLGSVTGWGQSNRGSITGTVTDATGAVVPGAAVTAVEQGTNTTYRTTSTGSGDYAFPQVQVGTYTVTGAAANFKTQQQTGVQVLIGTASTVRLVLSVGEATTTVRVDATAPALETTTSEIGGVITARQVVELPLSLGGVGAFRSPEAFAFLLPGTVGPGTANNANGIYIQKTSGGQNFGDDVLLDGTSAQRPDNGSTFDETAPSVEALQEFKVITATPPAQYDRTTGGIRSFTTRSGSNEFHGVAYDILRNTVLDANTWFNDLQRSLPGNGPGTANYGLYATPKDIKNDYGVSIGGPVLIPHVYNGRNKTFAYFAWEQVAWPRSGVSISTVPTALERQGNFSEILTTNQIGTNACTGAPVYAGQIYDPASKVAGRSCRTTPFAGNVIDPARFDAVAGKVLSYIPAPTGPGLVNNFSYRSSFPTFNTTYTIRVDQNVGASDHLFGSYNTRENTLLTGGTPVYPGPVDPNTWNQDFTTHYGRLGWDHNFTVNTENHLNLGYNRTNSKNQTTAVTGTDWAGQLGLGNVSGAAFPRFNINSGFPSVGQARDDVGVSNEWDIFDTLTLIRGRHTLAIGGEWRKIQFNNLANDNNAGTFNFSSNETAAGTGTLASQGGSAYASFLLGQVDSANLTVFPHTPQFNSNYWGLFVQDDFRVSQRLTLNLGVRYSIDEPRKESRNYVTNFDPNLPNPGAGNRLGALEFATNCGGCNPRLVSTYFKQVAPRIGFALTPWGDGKTVLRGGYAILYGPLYYADFGNSLNAGYAANPAPQTQDNFTPAFVLGGGFPTYQQAPILDPTLRNNQSVDYVAPNFNKPPMQHSWSLQVQQELAPDLIFTIGYVGNKAQNLRSAAGFGAYNNIRLSSLALGQNVLNQTLNASTAAATGFALPYAGFDATVADSLRPYPQYRRFNTDCCLENDGMSSYEALQMTLQRRFRDGLNLQASYTWSKQLNNADSLQPGANGGGGLYQNPFDLRQEKALSSQDTPHVFVLSGIYDLPVGRGRRFLHDNRALDLLVGGWQVGTILRYQSGQPLPFYCAAGVAGWDNCFRFNLVEGQPVLNPARHQSGYNPLVTPWVNNAAFVDPNADANAPIRFGSLPRVTGYRMDPYYDEAVNLAKNFEVTERVRFQLRADAFNLFNRHIFSPPFNLGPQPNAGQNTNFGFVNSTANTPRVLQMEFRASF